MDGCPSAKYVLARAPRVNKEFRYGLLALLRASAKFVFSRTTMATCCTTGMLAEPPPPEPPPGDGEVGLLTIDDTLPPQPQNERDNARAIHSKPGTRIPVR